MPTNTTSDKTKDKPTKAPRTSAAKSTAKNAAPETVSTAPVTSSIQSVNADSTGMKPQQRTDIDIEHYRQLLLDEMARLEEERDYVRKSNSDMDGNLPKTPKATKTPPIWRQV
jgi:hypothetical protein